MASQKDKALVANGIDDLLGGVLQNDRRRHGRTSPEVGPSASPSNDAVEAIQPSESDDSNTSHKVIKQYDKQTDKQADLQTIGQADNAVLLLSDQKVSSTEDKPAIRKSSSEALLKERSREAQQMAKSRTMTVTLRIPEELNAWLDEYVHLSFPERIKKQELVTEALQLIYARRGKAKEKVLETPLLPPQKADE